MAFVQNGGYEALSSSSGNISNTSSSTNPFGLKDFSRVLDQKFGNSAFSDNILAAPPGSRENINPFDAGGWKKPDIGDYYSKGSPYGLKPKGAGGKDGTGGVGGTGGAGGIPTNVFGSSSGNYDSGQASVFGGNPDNYDSSQASVFGGFNNGTGMSSGTTGRHKLDFNY